MYWSHKFIVRPTVICSILLNANRKLDSIPNFLASFVGVKKLFKIVKVLCSTLTIVWLVITTKWMQYRCCCTSCSMLKTCLKRLQIVCIGLKIWIVFSLNKQYVKMKRYHLWLNLRNLSFSFDYNYLLPHFQQDKINNKQGSRSGCDTFEYFNQIETVNICKTWNMFQFRFNISSSDTDEAASLDFENMLVSTGNFKFELLKHCSLLHAICFIFMLPWKHPFLSVSQ